MPFITFPSLSHFPLSVSRPIQILDRSPPRHQAPLRPPRLSPIFSPPVCRYVRVSVPIVVEAPRLTVYHAFSDLNSMSEWSACLESVQRDPEDNLYSEWAFRWRGIHLSWRARDGVRVEGETIAWESISGLKHIGRVTFEEARSGSAPEKHVTKVTMTVDYDLASLLATVAEMPAVSGFVENAIKSELKQFRQFALRRHRRQVLARTSV